MEIERSVVFRGIILGEIENGGELIALSSQIYMSYYRSLHPGEYKTLLFPRVYHWLEFGFQKVGSMLAFICAKSSILWVPISNSLQSSKNSLWSLTLPTTPLHAPPIYLSVVWLGVAALHPPLNPPSTLPDAQFWTRHSKNRTFQK